MELPDYLAEEIDSAFLGVQKPASTLRYPTYWEAPRYERYLTNWDKVDLSLEDAEDGYVLEIWGMATDETIKYFFPALLKILLKDPPFALQWFGIHIDETLLTLFDKRQLLATKTTLDYLKRVGFSDLWQGDKALIEKLIRMIQKQLDQLSNT